MREGDRVEAGALLVSQAGGEVHARYEQALAARGRAEARLAELQRGPRDEWIEDARARLAGAESALRVASRELARQRELFAQGVVSQERLDAALRARDTARAERDRARAGLDEMLEGTTAEELAQARAALEEATGALSAARLRRDRLALRAPRAGTIDALPYEIGERPPPGATLVVLLADAAPWARVFVPEPARAHVRPGDPATVYVDGLATPFAGRVRVVSREAAFTPFYALTERDRSRLAFEAEIDLVDPAAQALPTGVPVEVVLDLDRARGAPPARAVRATP